MMTISSPGSIIAALLALVLGVLAMTGAARAESGTPAGSAAPVAAAGAIEAGTKPAMTNRGLLAGRTGTGTAGMPSTASGGPLTALWIWMQSTQQRLHKSLAGAVRDLKTRDPFSAALALVTVSFLYGVFHAAGPGHGKAIISSYVLANERTVRRGIFLSFLAAGVQGLSALVFVAVLALLLNATGMTIKSTEHWIETISWALVAMVGAWLLYAQLKALLADRNAARATGTTALGARDHADGHGPPHNHHHPAHDHDHHHAHDTCGCGHDHGAHIHPAAAATGAPVLMKRASTGGETRIAARTATVPTVATVKTEPACAHAHDAAHDHHDCCGHAHMPTPDQLAGDLSWSKAMAIAFSVGIRPCTGAILVLLFALSQGMLWAGVLSTFAMAVGTAITVSALAALAVGSRELAKRLAGGGASRWGWHIERAAGLAGALLVMSLGTAFFFASLQPQAPF